LTVSSLIKFPAPTDPRTSSLVVFGSTADDVVIWGLVDQGNRYHDFVNLDAESGSSPPGVFLAAIDAPATISVRRYFAGVATLRVDRLVVEEVDALGEGPRMKALAPGIEAQTRVPMDEADFIRREEWPGTLSGYWLGALSRVLLRARRYGHGGAFLITPDAPLTGLNVKYQLAYNRLVDALMTRAAATIRNVNASDEIHDLLDADMDCMPLET
jgi:hypothetical protein